LPALLARSLFCVLTGLAEGAGKVHFAAVAEGAGVGGQAESSVDTRVVVLAGVQCARSHSLWVREEEEVSIPKEDVHLGAALPRKSAFTLGWGAMS